jgi:putative transposase
VTFCGPGQAAVARLSKPNRPWRTAAEVEITALEYVDWLQRLYEAGGDMPPAELEDAYYRHNTDLAEAR